jgi:hypothetical protein
MDEWTDELQELRLLLREAAAEAEAAEMESIEVIVGRAPVGRASAAFVKPFRFA